MDAAPLCDLVDPPCQGGFHVSANVAAARRPEFLEEGGPSLVRQIACYGRVTFPFEAKTVTVNDEIDVFGKPLDEPEGLGQGRPALEKQVWVPVGQPVVERVEDETDPEVLLHIARQRVEAARRGLEDVPSVLLRKSEKGLERLIHTATTWSVVMVRASSNAQPGRSRLFWNRSRFTSSGRRRLNVETTRASVAASGPSHRSA